MTSVAAIVNDQDFSANAPSAEDLVDAAALDAQIAATKTKINELLTALGLVIRDDDTLVDSIVRLRNLHPEVTTLIAAADAWQPKVACACATTANITLSGEQTIDGVTTLLSRVLVKNQTAAAENGIYVSAAGAWARATDADAADELGLASVLVSAGTTLANTAWVQSVEADDITLGTTALVWAQFGGQAGTVTEAGGGTGATSYRDWPTARRLMARVVAVANVTVASPGATIDSITMAVGDRVLLTAQSTGSQNGLWVWNGAAVAMTRPNDYSSASTTKAYRDIEIAIREGSVNGGTVWRLTTSGTITIDTTTTAWTTVAISLRSAVAAGTTASRTLATRFAQSFNVKDFGALGDGVTDDVVAIQAAVTAAQVAGGTVYFPLGSYLVSDEILVTKDGVRLVGEAVAESLSPGSRIVTNSTTKDVVRVSTSVQSISGFEAENISLYGAGSGGTTGSGLNLESITAGRSILSVRLGNLYVKNCKQHGIRFRATDTTGFIFDVLCDKIRTVNNYGSGVRADGLAIQVTWSRLYSESNAASQIAAVGADQTTTPQGWIFLGYAAASNPATVGTAAVYLENVKNFQLFNVWHESNQNAEFILKSCKGVKVDGGRISQAGTCDGVVIGFSGALAGGNIDIDIHGWSNTSSKTRIDVSQFAGGSFTLPIYLGSSADGPILVDEVTGYASAFPVDKIFFLAGQNHTRTAHIGRTGTVQSGTWTASGQPVKWTRTAAISTTESMAFEGPAGPAQLGGSGGLTVPLKGIKPTRVRFIYELANAGDAGDDVNVGLQIQTQPANGVVTPAATNKAFTYDTAHNSANKRANVASAGSQYNTMDCTITSPTWLGEGDQFVAIFQVVEANDAAHALAVVLRAVIVYYTEADQ